MTNEEAIKILKEDMRRYNCIIDSLKSGADSLTDGEAPLQSRGLAIKALEKQVPKRVAADIYDDGEVSHICLCGAEVEENQAYCDVCGQMIDWSDEV